MALQALVPHAKRGTATQDSKKTILKQHGQTILMHGGKKTNSTKLNMLHLEACLGKNLRYLHCSIFGKKSSTTGMGAARKAQDRRRLSCIAKKEKQQHEAGSSILQNFSHSWQPCSSLHPRIQAPRAWVPRTKSWTRPSVVDNNNRPSLLPLVQSGIPIRFMSLRALVPRARRGTATQASKKEKYCETAWWEFFREKKSYMVARTLQNIFP